MSADAAALSIERSDGPAGRADVEAVLARAFGPGRYAKTAYRLRERGRGGPWARFIARSGADMVGCVEFWPLQIGDRAALLLGPLAVDPEHKGEGIGLALMRHGIEAARSGEHDIVILVGDTPYYAKAGFAPVPPGQIRLPGPFDPARLLAAELRPGALAGTQGTARLRERISLTRQ